MAYIGNIPAEKFTSVDIQNFTVSATANYTLDRPVANENEIELFINNVRQHPGSGKAYTASGTALTLSEATAGTDTMYCVYQGKARQTVTPATSSVTNDMLAGSIDLTSKVTGALPQANIAGDAINADKIADDSISEEHLDVTAITGHPEKTSLVDADKFLISDSAASGALKYVQNSNLGGSPMVKLASGSASSSVNHYITGYMDSSKYNCYFITLSKIIGLQGNAFNFYFAKTSSTSTTSDHWHANYGWRSNGSAWNSQGEAATEIGFGSHLDAGANTVGSAYFYQYQNPATTAYGNSVDGRMWGYRADYGDYVSTFFSAGYNGTDAVVGFRLKAGGADATTFDYAIYGLEK